MRSAAAASSRSQARTAASVCLVEACRRGRRPDCAGAGRIGESRMVSRLDEGVGSRSRLRTEADRRGSRSPPRFRHRQCPQAIGERASKDRAEQRVSSFQGWTSSLRVMPRTQPTRRCQVACPRRQPSGPTAGVQTRRMTCLLLLLLLLLLRGLCGCVAKTFLKIAWNAQGRVRAQTLDELGGLRVRLELK